MASISNIIVLLAFNLLYSNLVQSSTYSKKLIFQQYNENPHSRQTNVTSKLSQKVDLFRDSVGRFSRTQSINKLEQDSCSCNSCLNGPSCRVENKIRSSRVYSDEDTEDDQSNVQCGEVLNSPNGIVTSPNYPNPFNVSGECLWKIKTSDGSRLVVNLIDLELDSSLNCTRNVLIVYDGPTDQDSQLLVACNQKQLADSLITSRGNELTIKLITNGSMNYFKGFKFYYETDCNNFIEDISGSIESPVYQNSKSLNCSWTIKVPKGNNISLVIEKFKSADSSCSSSYLSFIGNQSTKTFCQSVDYTDFDPILIADNQVQINFVHLNPGNQSYFRLEWKLVGCGGEIIESEGELVSPNYPDSYPNGLNCLWRLTGRPNQAIKISIDEYHIERNDSLQIFDGPNTRSHRLLNLSGRLHEPISLMTIRNQATISFGVDERFNGKGFKLSYQIHNNNYGCVNTFRTMKGSFASPGYPNRFARPSSCEYFPEYENRYVSVTIEDLDIPWSVNCTDHYVSFSDQWGTESARFCGDSFPTTPFKSQFNKHIRVSYFSKNLHNGRGFKASYQTTFDSMLYVYDTSNELSNFNYPPISTDDEASFHYHFDAIDRRKQTVLVFVDLAIKSNSKSYIELRDGKSNDTTKIVQYNNSSLPLSHIFGNSFHFYVKGQVLFKVLYSQYSDSCKYELNSWEGTFSSPGYPNDYPPSRTCVWKINLAPGNLISLKFHSFDIQYDQFCALDHLEIREENESGKLIGRFCGSNLPQLNSTQYYPSLWIRFKSHANSSASGFKASYKTIKDLKINSDSGKIGSFAYPRLFSSENNQSWTIKTSDSYKIKFKLEKIDILDDSFNDSCANSSVTIYDGPSVNSSILGQFCGYRADGLPIYTTSSVAYVHFKPNFHLSRFLLSWTSVNSDISLPFSADPNHLCKYTANLKLNQNATLFSSSYSNDVNCSWSISSPIGTQLRVEINEMDIKSQSDEKCTKNRVSFYDYSFDHKKTWNINRVLCENKDKLFILEGNQSLISFFNYGGSSAKLKGFNITVRPICGGTFYEPTGNIDSSLLGPFETCSWKIIVPKGRKVELKFRSFNLGSYNNYCSNGYLSIRGGASPNSRFIGHYCGSNLPTKIISNSNQLFISTYVPSSEQFEFSLSYRQVSTPCEFQVELDQSNPSAIIQLPQYPYSPVQYSECDWVIKAPIDRVIRIDFEIPDDDVKCDLNTTYIDIYEGSTQLSPKIGRFCPIARTTSVVTSDNRMLIHFVTKGGTGSSSFKATVNLHVCGGNYIIKKSTSIKSPSYPKPYDVNLTCSYNIYSTKKSDMLTYRFDTIDLPCKDNSSSGDYLAIYENDHSGKLVSKVCGTQEYEYRFIETHTNQLFMIFRSDSVIAGKGFQVWFEHHDRSLDSRIFMGSGSGFIETPRFPDIYPAGGNCSWFFIAPIENRVILNFTHYNLKPVDKVIIDYYPVQSIGEFGSDAYTISPENFTLPCKRNTSSCVIQSPNNKLAVYFETHSGLDAGQGFRADFRVDQPTECGGFINATSRSIISTNFSRPIDGLRISCAWEIVSETQESEQITPWISFETIEVFGSAENDSICSIGNITLSFSEVSVLNNRALDGHNIVLCGKSSKVITVNSPISTVFFRQMNASFHRTRGYRGFKATYHLSQCGGTIEESKGTIKTPGWPGNNYPIDTVCVWTIVNLGFELQLEFEAFELEDDCSKDNLLINEIDDLKITSLGRYCSKNKPPLIRSYKSGISIIFKSDGNTTGKGFVLTYKAIKSSCNEYRTSVTSYYDRELSPYKANQDCESILEVDPMYQLNLTFVNRFDIEDSVNCSKDYLDINEWRNNSYNHIGRYCGYNSPGSIIFKENKGKLVFHSDGDDRRGDGFDYYVTKYCRMTIDKRGNGTIKSPDYPYLYGINYCEWSFKGQEPNDTIFVHFNDFDLGAEEPCEDNYLEVIEKNLVTGHDSVRRYCAKNSVEDIKSHGNLKIISNSKKFGSSRGFNFDYQIFPTN